MEIIEERLIKLIQKLTPLIGADLNEVTELISNHNEYGIALENLCSIIEERSITINKIDLQEILALFRIMGFAEDAINYYSKSIRTIGKKL